ncbi:MAG: FtsW/RodA/SpoVE family cell cycle protein, partial [Clostridia bacterium]
MNIEINRKSQQHFDIPLFLTAYALGVFGVLAVTAATFTSSADSGTLTTLLARVANSYYGRWQGIFLLVSPFAVAGMMALDYRVLGKLSNVLYGAGLLLLVFVLSTNAISGVKGWFSILWDRTIQPSELVKIAVIIHLAKFLARKENPVENVRDFIRLATIIGVPLLLILVQGEMGSAMVFAVFFFAMLFISGVDIRLILGIILAGVSVVIPAVFAMRASGSYRFDRILAFFDPTQASADATYQAANSKVAIGSGGNYGEGMFQDGSMSALNFVPQDHTDFVFSAI